MAGKFDPVPGTGDIWEPEASEWVFLENAARDVFQTYSYAELRTPVMERTELFVRGIGEDTDVVQKEMYSFEDRGGRSLTLRPEGTAGVIRAIANAGLNPGEEKRIFYNGPMFRGEKPASGRRRQFHQVGVEAVGSANPFVDAESILMLLHYLDRVGVTNRRLLLNTRGLPEERKSVEDVLSGYFSPYTDQLCADCQRRLQTNVWRILDCKNEGCQPIIKQAPVISDYLSQESRQFFSDVCDALSRVGVEYEIAPRLVRGLDYYQHTVFEVIHDGLGAQDAIAGGGRYRLNVPGLKKPLEGVGFAAGTERLIMARQHEGQYQPARMGPDVYLANLMEGAIPEGLALAEKLRNAGWRVYAETENKSLKAQMRKADKLGAMVAVIRGEEEVNRGVVTCRDLTSSEQTECTEATLHQWLEQHVAGAVGTAAC